MLPLPPVTKNLIFTNIAVYLLCLILSYQGLNFVIEYFQLYTPALSSKFMPHQLITYMFLHDLQGFMHIAFNMLALYMFGRDIEYAIGSKKFFLLYIIGGVGAGLLHTGIQYWELSQLIPQYGIDQVQFAADKIATVGASGSVYALLAAYAMLYPNRQLMLLFPPIPMKAKYFVLIFALIELFSGIRQIQSLNGATNIAHFAHVGGAIFGFLLILYWRKKGEGF